MGFRVWGLGFRVGGGGGGQLWMSDVEGFLGLGLTGLAGSRVWGLGLQGLEGKGFTGFRVESNFRGSKEIQRDIRTLFRDQSQKAIGVIGASHSLPSYLEGNKYP